MHLIRLKKNVYTDDAALINAYRETGNKQVIGLLFERYAPLVFGVCMKYLKDEDDCKDAVLQIFEKLMLDLKKYEISKFSGWLHSVAKNYCLMQLRNKAALIQQQESIKEHELFMESQSAGNLDDDNFNEKHLANLELAIQSLTTDQKICIELFYLKEESYQYISELTGFSLNQVKSHIQNGKRNLKITLQKMSYETAR